MIKKDKYRYSAYIPEDLKRSDFAIAFDYEKNGKSLNQMYDRLKNEIKFGDCIPYDAGWGLWRLFNKSMSKVERQNEGKSYVTAIVLRARSGEDIVIVPSKEQDEYGLNSLYDMRTVTHSSGSYEEFEKGLRWKQYYENYDVISEEKGLSTEEVMSAAKKIAQDAQKYHFDNIISNHVGGGVLAFLFGAAVSTLSQCSMDDGDSKVKVNKSITVSQASQASSSVQGAKYMVKDNQEEDFVPASGRPIF